MDKYHVVFSQLATVLLGSKFQVAYAALKFWLKTLAYIYGLDFGQFGVNTSIGTYQHSYFKNVFRTYTESFI